ncbi:hypothetical protein [Agrobacterium fabrum]|uniref:hypothetical protein n=1 Tax=Agrobacterium fabrum TaxID=1176649 RepID=UPI0011799209|nr:hypothetical protein [Agrobacterium fabrum]
MPTLDASKSYTADFKLTITANSWRGSANYCDQRDDICGAWRLVASEFASAAIGVPGAMPSWSPIQTVKMDPPTLPD